MNGSSNKEIPLVSVVIPSYNRVHLLKNAINSILMQNIASVEIIIADDGSTDITKTLISELQKKYPFIVYVANTKNMGESAARNLGVKAATGKYIAFLDSDDEWMPDKLNQQISYLEENEGRIQAVSTSYFLVDSHEKSYISPWHPEKPLTALNLLKYGCNVSFGSTICMRKDIFDDVGNFDISLPIFVDLDWLCRFANMGFTMGKIDQPLVNYYKAPMRRGEFLESGVIAFKKKHKEMLLNFNLFNRLCIESQFFNYISLAYFPNGPFKKFFKTRLLHFLYYPIQHPGNYWHFIINIIKNVLGKNK